MDVGSMTEGPKAEGSMAEAPSGSPSGSPAVPGRARYGTLVRLELRRSLGPWTALAVVALAALLAAADWTPAALSHAPGAGERELAALGRGLRRQAVWGGALLFLIPALAFHGAGLVGRWRAGEGDWLGSSPARPLGALVASWAGIALGGLAPLGATAALAEFACRGGGPTLARTWSGGPADAVHLEPRLENGQTFKCGLELGATVEGARLAVRLRPSIGAAPTTDARVSLTRDGVEREARVRLATRTWVEVELVSGPGPVVLAVENLGPGAMAVMDGESFALWSPGGAEGRASLGLLARGALAVAVTSALAVGFGAWVGAATAGLGALCALLVATAFLGAPRAWPGADLARALDPVSLGRLPEPMGFAPWLGALGLVAAGMTLARGGMGSWRHGP